MIKDISSTVLYSFFFHNGEVHANGTAQLVHFKELQYMSLILITGWLMRYIAFLERREFEQTLAAANIAAASDSSSSRPSSRRSNQQSRRGRKKGTGKKKKAPASNGVFGML